MNKIERYIAIKDHYQHWLKKNSLSSEDYIRIKNNIKELPYQPLISVILPVYNVEEKWLRKCIDSVINQLYLNWELCIADDASTKPHIRKVLKKYKAKDNRIKVIFREKNGHISAASNSALAIAEGEFIALLDHDDELTVDALYENVLLLNKHPEADMIYSDEDKMDEGGRRHSPFFKPDWSPDTLLSQMYTCHLGVYRTTLIREIGGFRLGFEGSQDYDLVLRFAEKTKNIYHIPKVLYHWRTIVQSAASNPHAKPYAYKVGVKALEEALSRRGEIAKVESVPGYPGNYHVNYILHKEPMISIIIPTRDNPVVLESCLKSLYEKTEYNNYEIILIDNGSLKKETFNIFDHYKLLFNNRLNIIRLDIPFNHSMLNNKAVKVVNGELILLLHDDIEIITSDWLVKMAGQALREKIGAVGVKLLYPDNTIQHAGIILGIKGLAGYSHEHFYKAESGYAARLMINSNYAAVSGGCLMVKKKLYEQVGGLDEKLPVAFNDIDFCLKLLNEKVYNIILPDVQLYHHESKSKGLDNTRDEQKRFKQELSIMQQRWAELIRNDPFYNPNLTLDKEDFSLKI